MNKLFPTSVKENANYITSAFVARILLLSFCSYFYLQAGYLLSWYDTHNIQLDTFDPQSLFFLKLIFLTHLPHIIGACLVYTVLDLMIIRIRQLRYENQKTTCAGTTDQT